MTRCCENCKNVPCQVRDKYVCTTSNIREDTIKECLTILEEPQREFQKHFTYTDGKEYELWGTALNRITEAIISIQKLHPRYPEFIGENNPCNECIDPTNCDEICEHTISLIKGVKE